MSYEVIKTINGRRYRYLQETHRENGKVKTRNRYIGPLDGHTRRKANTVEKVIERGVTAAANVAGAAIEKTAHFVQRGLDSLVGELVSTERVVREKVKSVIPSPRAIVQFAKKGTPDQMPEVPPGALPPEPSQPSEQSAGDASP